MGHARQRFPGVWFVIFVPESQDEMLGTLVENAQPGFEEASSGSSRDGEKRWTEHRKATQNKAGEGSRRGSFGGGGTRMPPNWCRQ